MTNGWYTLDQRMIHTEEGQKVFIMLTQNDMQFKIHEWFVSGIFHLIFSDRG